MGLKVTKIVRKGNEEINVTHVMRTVLDTQGSARGATVRVDFVSGHHVTYEFPSDRSAVDFRDLIRDRIDKL